MISLLKVLEVLIELTKRHSFHSFSYRVALFSCILMNGNQMEISTLNFFFINMYNLREKTNRILQQLLFFFKLKSKAYNKKYILI